MSEPNYFLCLYCQQPDSSCYHLAWIILIASVSSLIHTPPPPLSL